MVDLKILIALTLCASLQLGCAQEVSYKRGLTDHFIYWLNVTGYEPYGFNRTEFFGGSFGGREYEGQLITKKPVIFVHGDADMIIGEISDNNGFRYSIEHFLSKGYTKAEIYGSMWGFADIPNMPSHRHHKEYVIYVRTFIEAVLEYTGAPMVDVIAHSMGCTMTRKALKGGWSNADKVAYFIGEPLYPRVDTFISIAGGHQGNPNCLNSTRLACSKVNGFWPGDIDGDPLPNQSTFLYEMNIDPQKEAQHTYSIWSLQDNSAPTFYMYGRPIGEWPTMDKSYVFNSPDYTHLVVRDNTTEMQYNLVTYHKFIFDNDTTSEAFMQ